MTPLDAAKLLELPADASPEKIEARFLELRTKLEDKIAKAPTPGLKEKYRATLNDITTAFETLTLSADSSTLPVLQRDKASAGAPPGGSAPVGSAQTDRPSSGDATSPARPAPKAKGGSKEFIFVAIIAVVLLGVGGWWVMKSREEAAERARVAAAAEAAQQAETARLAAIETELRTALAETAVLWEAATRAENDADRQLSTMQSELRSRRDATPAIKAEMEYDLIAFESYTKWLRDVIGQHPYKLVRARVETLLKAGSIEDAARDLPALRDSLSSLKSSLAANRDGRTTLTIVSPVPDATWELRDSLGRVRSGQGSATVSLLPFGSYDFRAARAPLASSAFSLRLAPLASERPKLVIDMPHGVVLVPGLPAGTIARLDGQNFPSSTEETFVLPFGTHELQLRHPDFLPRVVSTTLASDAPRKVLNLEWISVKDPVALLREFVSDVESGFSFLADQTLGNGLDAAQRAGVSLDIIREVWTKALHRESNARYTHPSKQMDAQLRLVHRLRHLNPALARQTVQSIANDLAQVHSGDRAAYFGVFGHMALALTPEATLSLLHLYADAMVASQKPQDAARFYRLYLELDEPKRAEAWRERCLAEIRDRENVEKQFGWIEKWIPEHRGLIDRWAKARATNAYGDLPALVAATNAIAEELHIALVNEIGNTYFTLGYDRALVQWLRANNSPLTNWLQKLVAFDRFDLAEELVEHTRDAGPLPDDLMASLALAHAVKGNTAKARLLDQKIVNSNYYSVMTKRALVNALLGDKTAANSLLDRVEKSSNALVPTTSWRYTYRRNMNAAALVLGDPERAARVDAATGLEPGYLDSDILAMIGRFDIANEKHRNLKENAFNLSSSFKDFVAATLLRPGDALSEIDLHHPLLRRELTLELLERLGARTPRSYHSPAVPVSAKVPAVVLKSSYLAFPAAAANRGVTKGEAKLRVLVRADGVGIKTEPVSSTEPEFASALAASVTGWTYAPALAKGKPVDDWLEVTRSFNK